MHEDPPWLRFYGDVPRSLDYPDVTLNEAVMRSVARVPDAIAFDFLGYRRRYRELGADIERCAAGLASAGLRAGDRITIATPTCPQGVIAFYAASRLGAVPAMIHPLSTAPEIEYYLNASRSKIALTLDAFYGKFAEVRARTPLETLVLARIPDCLPLAARLGFLMTKQRSIPRVPHDPAVIWWSQLLQNRDPPPPEHRADPGELAAILFSGGTTGHPKGIMLSHRNLISEGLQVATWARMRAGDSILAVLPIFHGFGLGVCINAAFMGGGEAVMVPVFTAEAVAQAIRRRRPNLLAGVPTLFDALAKDRSLERADLSCLRATFSGADTLPPAIKARFEALVERRGGRVRLLEGYGLTEAVSAIMATPIEHYREGSIGVPFPDMLAKICRPGSSEEVPIGAEGEICIHGPAVMLGYLDDTESTRETLREHPDGRIWLHTGDLGRRDADGFFYFGCRLKRMIKSSGFNVYPTQVEAVLYRHAAVAEACVIGVPDESQVERVRACVVVKPGFTADTSLADALMAHCREHLIKWSCPREIDFRESLPRTRVGKIDYKALESEVNKPPPRVTADI
jgi:long-chain acyl-CoA synthetase